MPCRACTCCLPQVRGMMEVPRYEWAQLPLQSMPGRGCTCCLRRARSTVATCIMGADACSA